MEACLRAAKPLGADTPSQTEQEAQKRTLAEAPPLGALHTRVRPSQAELGYLEAQRASDGQEQQGPRVWKIHWEVRVQQG